MNFGTLTAPESGVVSNKTEVPVKKSRARKCWDSMWAKPKNWWSARSETEKSAWRYLLGLLIIAAVMAVMAAMVYLFHTLTPRELAEQREKWHEKRMDTVKQDDEIERRILPVKYPLTITESACPSEARAWGLSTTSTAQPSTIAVSFTA